MKIAPVWLLVSLALLLSGPTTHAEVRLPAVIGDHMVLQQNQKLPIWGWAEPGEAVSVSLGENRAATKTNDAGEWRVDLAAMKPSDKPLEMTVTGTNTIKLKDILVGEVWVGSGQSNMQWSVRQTQDAQAEIAAAKYPSIRLFSVPLVPSGTPSKDVNARWVVCSPNTVSNFSAVLYFFGRELHTKLGQPVGLIGTSWGGTRIEPWIPPTGFASQPELKQTLSQITQARSTYDKTLKQKLGEYEIWVKAAKEADAAGQPLPDPPPLPSHPLNSNGAPTGLYNGMVHALVPFAIRGSIWYQGESNVGIGMKYHTLMKGLIQGWRNVWDQGDFPFLFVQLAPYRYGGNPTRLPEIWEAQTATLSYPNTGMAVIHDVGNTQNIHPTNKQEVGRRLALWALAKTYGDSQLVYSGPLYESMRVVLDEEIQIKLKHAQGLKSSDGKPLSWFTIAGKNKKFVPAVATISGDTLEVRSDQVAKPVAVRFAWHMLAEPNLVNGAGLPASPFRTDQWSDAKIPETP